MNKRGFTIIELLVTVAIIAVLTAIVLVNVQSYVSKSRNATIKATLQTVQTSGALYLEETGGYAGFCTSSYINAVQEPLIRANDLYRWCRVAPANDIWCFCSSTDYSIAFSGPLFKTICVDSTGYNKEANDPFCQHRCGGWSAPVNGTCGDGDPWY